MLSYLKVFLFLMVMSCGPGLLPSDGTLQKALDQSQDLATQLAIQPRLILSVPSTGHLQDLFDCSDLGDCHGADLQLLGPIKGSEGGLQRLVAARFHTEVWQDQLRLWQEQGVVLEADVDDVHFLGAQTSESGEPPLSGALALEYQQRYTQAYWLHAVNLMPALDTLGLEAQGPRLGPVIAVLDSGFDTEHPALKDAFYHHPAGYEGCSGSALGCNTASEAGRQWGDHHIQPLGLSAEQRFCGKDLNCLHGTHVAGIIAGAMALDYAGVCPQCRILPVKVVSEEVAGGLIFDRAVLQALYYIRDLKNQGVPVRVVNASFGKFRRSRRVSDLMHQMFEEGAGVLFVAAAGNEASQLPAYPASLEAVMAVANVDSRSGQRHASSNYGSWIDLAAPGSGICWEGFGLGGSGILSAVPGGGAACLEGSSFSAPIVAGVAGLLLLQQPELSARQLKHQLLASANPEAISINGGWTHLLGAGMVDAASALEPQSSYEPGPRIKGGCGVLGGQPQHGLSWLLLPCLIAVCLARRPLCRKHG